MPKRIHRRSGAILIKTAIFLSVLLGFLSIAIDLSVFYSKYADLQITASSAASGAALDLPDGAVATALRLAEANMPPSAHGTVLKASDVQVGKWDGETKTFTPTATSPNAVRVTARSSSANGNAVSWPIGRVLGLQPLNLTARSTALLLPELPGAIGATGSISVTGNASSDSYDSSEGPYDPATSGEDGSIVADGSVSVGGSGVIKGDVKGDVSSTGSATITGSVSEVRRPLEFPSVDTTDVATNNENSTLPLIEKGGKSSSPLDQNRNFTLKGGAEYTIPPGVYYFNDLKLSGQSSLFLTGPIDIYLTGDLDTSGGDLVNASQDPNNLRIFMTGGTAKLNASVDWYGLLYAPDSQVTVNGSGEIYGAIIGENVSFSGTGDVHFDTNLSVGDVIDGISSRSSIVD